MDYEKRTIDGIGKDWNYFIWSDNWHIEEDKAWLVDGERDILCNIDLELNKCVYITDIPNIETNKFRLNQRCLKIDNEIYLMPDNGKKIWVYSLKNNQFEQIVIDNPDNVHLGIYRFWIYGNKIYALSTGLKKIIEINIKKKVVCNYFILSNLDEEEIDNLAGIRVGEDIYCVSSSSNRVYQFNLETKQVTTYVVPMVEGGFQTISFDGRLFWLTGYCKEIDIWDKENDSTNVLRDFPHNFGIYDFTGNSENVLDCTAVKYDTPTFIASMLVGKYIWFIPYQTNKVIYVDVETYQIYTLEIGGEEENKSSLLMHYLEHKYLVQYIRDERYIGLFSFKNDYIIEIDTVEKRVEKKSYIFDEESIDKLFRSMNGRTLNERNAMDRVFFLNRLIKNNTSDKEKMNNAGSFGVGISIYREIIENQ